MVPLPYKDTEHVIHMNKTLYNTNMKYMICTAVHSLLGRKSYCTNQKYSKVFCQKLLYSTMHTTYELPAEKKFCRLGVS